MTATVLIIIVAAAAVAGLAAYFRTVSMEPSDWHADPVDVQPPSSPNFSLRAGASALAYPGPLDEAAGLLGAQAEAEGAVLLAGDLAQGHATYVARTTIMGYPDAVSIRLEADGAQTRIHIFSRSRFGYSDLGANEARVRRWVAPLGLTL